MSPSSSYRTFVPVPPAERPALHRDAVRVLLVGHRADGERVLLFEDTDPGVPGLSWWMTPGGGIDHGESERGAAVRELAEETGLQVTGDRLVGPVARRVVVHGYSDQVITQSESFWLLEVDRFDVDVGGHTAEEQLTIQQHRWWPVDELAGTDQAVWPAELLALVGSARTGAPALDLGWCEESSVPVAPASDVDAVVLAGGAARRWGGVSKPDLELGGRRLLDHVLDALGGPGTTVVVGPPGLVLPDGVRRSQEDPPRGGPVAGVVAGLAELARDRRPGAVTLLLGCDTPFVAGALPRLLAALGDQDVDGAVLLDAGDRPQWLVGAYRTGALARVLSGDGRGRALQAVLAPLRLARVRARGAEADDVDTPADLARLT